MKKQKINFALFFFAVLSANYSGAVERSGADFLQMPQGARAMGLGQAFTALSLDVDSLNWNVAGLAKQESDLSPAKSFALSLSHQSLSSGNQLDQVGFMAPIQNISVGLNVLRMSYPDFEGRLADRSGAGSFSASDTALGAALAANLGAVQIGGQFKMIQQKLANESASGSAVDLGIISQTPLQPLTLGASARNLGPKMKFKNDSYNLPFVFSLGAAYQLLNSLTAALDVQSWPHTGKNSLGFGMEMTATKALSLRGGYLTRLSQGKSGSYYGGTSAENILTNSGFSGGFGLNINSLALDYAFSPFGEFGQTHVFTLTSHFGSLGNSPTKKPKDTNSNPDEKPQPAVIFSDPKP